MTDIESVQNKTTENHKITSLRFSSYIEKLQDETS